MRLAQKRRLPTGCLANPDRRFFARWIALEATVLDLGCGWGEFINQVRAARRFGMDLNPEAPAKLLGRLFFLRSIVFRAIDPAERNVGRCFRE